MITIRNIYKRQGKYLGSIFSYILLHYYEIVFLYFYGCYFIIAL